MDTRQRIPGLVASLCAAFMLQVAQADTPAEMISSTLQVKYPDMPIDEVMESPVQGLYEVRSGSQIFLVSSDAAWVVTGDLIRLSDEFNRTEARVDEIQWQSASAIPESDMIVYEPPGDTVGEMTVFSDTTCGYCRKLHSEREQLLSRGIRIRYVLYPRAGIESETAQVLESVWCADDPNAALTAAKLDNDPEPRRCDNPIASNIEHAKAVGLQGTPMLFLGNGKVVRGYRPAEELIELLDLSPGS